MNRTVTAAGLLALGLLVAGSSRAADLPGFDKVVNKIEARFDPPEAKPGQTVTLKVTVSLIEGWHTYPTVQADPAARGQTNRFAFPPPGPVVFVGKVQEPANPKVKPEPALNIDKLQYYVGSATWECKGVVSPEAKAGLAAVPVKFRVLVCDKDNCLPPKTIPLEVKIKVAEGPAVPVDPAYKEIVQKALAPKP